MGPPAWLFLKSKLNKKKSLISIHIYYYFIIFLSFINFMFIIEFSIKFVYYRPIFIMFIYIYIYIDDKCEKYKTNVKSETLI